MHDPPDERMKVELPFIEQLRGLEWNYLPGDTRVPYLTEQEPFREVLRLGPLREAARRINVDDQGSVRVGRRVDQ